MAEPHILSTLHRKRDAIQATITAYEKRSKAQSATFSP